MEMALSLHPGQLERDALLLAWKKANIYVANCLREPTGEEPQVSSRSSGRSQPTTSKKRGMSVLQHQGNKSCQQPVSYKDSPVPQMRSQFLLPPWFQPGETLSSTQPACAGFLVLMNYEMINLCCLKPKPPAIENKYNDHDGDTVRTCAADVFSHISTVSRRNACP